MATKKRASKFKKARPKSPASNSEFSPGASFPVVGVGASAGGLEALSAFLKALSARAGMAIVVIQHLAPEHESALTQLLSKATPMPVLEVSDGMAMQPNHVYVIPPNKSMTRGGWNAEAGAAGALFGSSPSHRRILRGAGAGSRRPPPSA